MKTYIALLTQTGDSPPIAQVLVNTLGGEVAWTRDQQGFYRGALAGAFPAGKTFLTMTKTRLYDFTAGDTSVNRDNDDSVLVVSSDGNGGGLDGVLNGAIGDGIEIRVFSKIP